MEVQLVDYMGDDTMVVNAARVSFDKHHISFREGDEKLIRYLAEHGHWTPFSHPQICLRVSVPIFVARQLDKHQVGLARNEVSRRYVDSKPKLFSPDAWRLQSEDNKQGSAGYVDVQDQRGCWEAQDIANRACLKAYDKLLAMGVAKEQARIVLPVSHYTSWYWTGSLYAFARICNLRMKPDAQQETREVAKQINEIITELFPISWQYLLKV